MGTVFNEKWCICLAASTAIISNCLHHYHSVIKYRDMKNEHFAYAWKFQQGVLNALKQFYENLQGIQSFCLLVGLVCFLWLTVWFCLD